MGDLVPILACIALATVTTAVVTYALAMGAAITITYLCHRRTT